ncbi:MAG: type II secretion system protein, partial [Chloroflexi bacterium]|nr:type II secretion system protein [Chloroflexota bacterium]
MRIPKKGQKGFTLIELLIVVAILGVLAAVVIPNVGRFLGRGEAEARRTEFHNISSAVIAMMTDNGITAIPNPVNAAGLVASNQMGLVGSPATDGFPDYKSEWTGTPGGKTTDPAGAS